MNFLTLIASLMGLMDADLFHHERHEMPVSGVKSNELLRDQEEADTSRSPGLVAVARFISLKWRQREKLIGHG